MTTTGAPEGALQPKMHLTGKVIKTTLAGAVVDIGLGKPGVVHISQLSAEPVNRVEDVVKEGQVVDVWVRRVREDRVELTMIQPPALDWKEIQTDMLVKGKVVRLESYGAFIDIGAERPGLVHVSEIAHGYVRNPADVLKEGQEVEAKVIGVDRRKRQIRLSLKAAQPEEETVVKKAAASKQQRKGKKKTEEPPAPETAPSEEEEAEATAMAIAYREALARANGKNIAGQEKRRKKNPAVNEEIFERTLKGSGLSIS